MVALAKGELEETLDLCGLFSNGEVGTTCGVTEPRIKSYVLDLVLGISICPIYLHPKL